MARNKMPRVRPQKMCKKHPTIPVARTGGDLCANCLKLKDFGDQTMRGKAAGAAK